MPNTNRLEGDLKPQARQVLTMLRTAGKHGVSNGDFIRAYISRFGGRLHELRAVGFEVETTREGQGKSRYILRAEPTGVGAGAHTPASASVDPGGSNLARPKDSDQPPAAGLGGDQSSGGGTLFSLEDFTSRRGYADAEGAAA